METKCCGGPCGEEKPLSAFYKDASKKDGCSSFCRECCKKSSRTHYANNHDAVRELQRQYRIDHKDQIKEQKSRWRAANLGHARKKSREWGQENKDRQCRTHREWSEGNREHLREYHQRWRELNREHYSKYQHDYRIQNPHIILNGANRRRARTEKFSYITKQDWCALMSQYGWKCFYCDETLTNETRTVDHLIPLSKGGRHHIMNLIPCCRCCNREKNAAIYPVWQGIKALDENKQAHLVSRIVGEMCECHLQVSGNACLDQLFREMDGIFKSQVVR